MRGLISMAGKNRFVEVDAPFAGRPPIAGFCPVTEVSLRAPIARRAMTLSALLLLLVFLAACNSSGSITEGLSSVGRPEPNAPVGQQTAQTDDGSAGTLSAGETSLQDTATASLAGGARAVTFLPVSNAPQSAVSALAKSIREAAESASLPVVAGVEQGAQYQVKGYFSALEDGSGTLLVYVWDVLDRNNKRVYRINGQEQASTRSADPWSAITPQMLDRVARSTVSQLSNWISTRG